MEMTANIMFSFWSTVLMCSILSILVYFRLSRGRPKSDGTLPPSPWRLPLIGNIDQIATNLHHGFYALSQRYGPLILVELGSGLPFCVISSGHLAREVTNTHEALFSDRPTTKASRMLFPMGDDIIFAPDDKLWRLRRKLCVYELLSPKRVQSFEYIRKEEVAKLVTTIKLGCLNNKSEINMSNLFLELSTNVISRAALGLRVVKDVDGDGHNDVDGKLALQGAHAMGGLFSFEDCIPALAWLDHLTGLNKRLKKTCDSIHAFLDKLITESKNQIRSESENLHGKDTKSLVDIILELQEKDMVGIELIRSNIRSILLDMFIGGIATTMTTLEWAMAELARNPMVMKKAQDEVRSIVGQKSEIHEHDIAQMEYMKCVIKETLRLHGPTMTGRQTSTTSATIGGFIIPAKIITIINIWTIHRDPSAWDSPLKFLPDRFLNNSYNFKGQDQTYFPFGLGKRICPGANFAMKEVECALANVLCWFDWELPDGMQAEDLDMRGSNSPTSHRISPICLVPKLVGPVPDMVIS